jgi:chromosome segregation ATPase
MSATVVPIREAASPDPLAELLAEIANIDAELARLGVVDARMSEAQAALAKIDDEIRALDAAEVEAWRKWGAAGQGTTPAANLDRRKELSARRAEADAKLAVARNGVAAIAPKIAELQVKRRAAEARVRDHMIASALDEARRLDAVAADLAKQLAEPLHSIRGLRTAFVDLAQDAMRRGDNGVNIAFSKAVEEIDKLAPPALMSDPTRIADLAAEWRRNLA